MAAVLAALSAQSPNPSTTAAKEPRPLTWPASLPFVPNFADVQAGDLVLVKADQSAIGATIQGVQASLLSSAPPNGDPAWTHVGLYVDAGLMVEAVPGRGVRYCPVSQYARTRDIRVRRLLRQGRSVSPSEGEQVVQEAAEFFEQKYSYWSIVKHLMMQTNVSNSQDFFCSTFVSIVFTKGLKVLLDTQSQNRPLFPATLANHAMFDDVDLEWRFPL